MSIYVVVSDPFQGSSCSKIATAASWKEGTFGKPVVSREGGIDLLCRVKSSQLSELEKLKGQGKINGVLRSNKLSGRSGKSIEVPAEISKNPPGVIFKFPPLCEGEVENPCIYFALLKFQEI